MKRKNEEFLVPDFNMDTSEIHGALALWGEIKSFLLKTNLTVFGKEYRTAIEVANANKIRQFFSDCWNNFWLGALFFAGFGSCVFLSGANQAPFWLGFIMLGQFIYAVGYSMFAGIYERRMAHSVLRDPYARAEWLLSEAALALRELIKDYLFVLEKDEKQHNLILREREETPKKIRDLLKKLDQKFRTYEILISFKRKSVGFETEQTALVSGMKDFCITLESDFMDLRA